MEEESHMTSAVAFVEGGVQDACDDACSICLEPFTDDDPASVTSCKHEYHLQCILEWAQRSQECPMCWQFLSLKDPTSQELLAAVEQERSVRLNRSPNSPMLARNSVEEFEFHHVPAYTDDSDFEERIMQHLAAAAMGRANYFSRRENHRHRSSGQGQQPPFVLFTTNSNAPPTSPMSPEASEETQPRIFVGENTDNEAQTEQRILSSPPPQIGLRASENSSVPSQTRSESVSPRDNIPQSPDTQQRSRASEIQSFAESFKSRFSAVSARYKESISRSTRGFREKLLSRNNTVTELSKEVQREVTAGVARMMERLDPMNKNNGTGSSVSADTECSSAGNAHSNVNNDFHFNGSPDKSAGSSSSQAALDSAKAVNSQSLIEKSVTPVGGVSVKIVKDIDTKDAGDRSSDSVSASA